MNHSENQSETLLNNLPDVARRQLGGLEATPTLLAKIKLEAADRKRPRTAAQVLRPVMAVCAALVLCVGAALTLAPEGDHSGLPLPTQNVMDSHSAGTAMQPTAEPRTLGDVPQGSIVMSAGRRGGSGMLFAEGTGASFPLVSLGGATYRLLESPSGISESLLGAEMGTVTEFNIEPALGSGGVVSNAVSCGEPVYAVGNHGGALVSAKLNGSWRVFQRVSYAGTAVIGQEKLQDVLCGAQDAEWISIDGLGRVDDAAMVQELMDALLNYADYESTAFTGGDSMQIGLKNGLVLQLTAADDSISACGTWSCPDFFELFVENAK